MTERTDIWGAILAGGRARRLGGRGKGGLVLGGKPLIAHVRGRLAPQVGRIVVNAPADFVWTGGGGTPETVPDLTVDGRVEAFAGPLAGILSVLEWAAERDGPGWVATVPTDTPFLPEDFVARARTELDIGGADLACASSGGRDHAVIALWPVALAGALRRMLVEEGERRMGAVLERFRVARIDYPAEPFDPFFNVNTFDDLAEAEHLLASPR